MGVLIVSLHVLAHIGMEEEETAIDSVLSNDSHQQAIFQDASNLIKDLNAPRAPATPSRRHVSRRSPQKAIEMLNDSKIEDTNLNVIDRIDKKVSLYHFYGTPDEAKRAGKRSE